MKNFSVPQPGIVREQPTLSVCMIVRNEEKVLPRCLKSVRGVADELIVVDTGSTDNTISIARDLGAKVFHFKWSDDFSAARNEYLKHATGDWILQIDADEELLPGSIPHVKDGMSRSKVLQYVVICDNGPTYPARRFSWIDRLFRNHPKLSYHRPYHEGIDSSIDDLISAEPQWQVQYEPHIVIRHHGYEQAEMRRKCERGLRMMKSYLKKNPDDDYILSKLGGTCYLLGHYNEAEAYYSKALEISPDLSETHFDLAMTLQRQKKLEAAIKCYQNAIATDPRLTIAYVNLGAIYIQKGMLDEAISELTRAVAIDPNLALAHSYMGLAYRNKGMSDESVAELKWAAVIDSDVGQAHMKFGMTYREEEMLDEAVTEFKLALAINPALAEGHENLARVYYLKKQYELAEQHCDKAAKLAHKVDPRFLQDLKAHR